MSSDGRWPIFRRYPDTDEDKVDAATGADFATVFQSDQGARVLAQIMIDAGIFNSTLSTDRVNRDMIDGKRELALSIAERAGFVSDRIPFALITDNLKTARKEKNDGRHGNTRGDPAPKPIFDTPLGDD